MKKAKDIYKIYRVMKHELVIQVIRLLKERDYYFSELKEALEYHNTARILARMQKAKLIKKYRESRVVYYHLNEDRIAYLNDFFEDCPPHIVHYFYGEPAATLIKIMIHHEGIIHGAGTKRYEYANRLYKEGILGKKLRGNRAVWSKGLMYEYYLERIKAFK